MAPRRPGDNASWLNFKWLNFKWLNFKLLAGLLSVSLGGVLAIAPGVALNPPSSPPPPPRLPSNFAKQRGDRLWHQGIQAYQAQQWAVAIAHWRAAYQAYQAAQDLPGAARALAGLGGLYIEQEQYRQAIAVLTTLEPLISTWQQPYPAALAQANLAIAYEAVGQYRRAIALNKAVAQQLIQLKQRPEAAKVLHSLGKTWAKIGNYHEAEKVYKISWSLAQAAQDWQEANLVLNSLGEVYAQIGNAPAALNAYQTSLANAQALQDLRGQATVWLNLGALYQGNSTMPAPPGTTASQQAEHAYHQSLALARQAKFRELESAALGALGTVAEDQRQFSQAIAYLEQSLAIARSLDNPVIEGKSLNNLGHVFYSMGDLERAETTLRQAIQRLDQIRSGTLPSALGEEIHSQSNAQFHPNSISKNAFNLDEKNNSNSIQDSTSSIIKKSSDFKMTGAINSNPPTIANSDAALPTTLNSNAISRPSQSAKSDLTTRDTYQISIFDTQVQTYNLLVQVLVAAQKGEAALEVSEQSRARVFAASLANRLRHDPVSQVPLAANLTPPDLTAADSPTAAHSSNDHSSKNRLSANSDLIDNPLQPSESTLSIQQIRHLAQSQQATLIEYAIVPDDAAKFQGKQRGREAELLIWVVQPSGKITLRRVDLKPLWPQGLSLSQLVSLSRCYGNAENCEAIAPGRGLGWVPTPPTPHSPTHSSPNLTPELGLKQLHHYLIAPIADLLPPDPQQPVVIIPQESLFLVPFAALKSQDNRDLISRHTLLSAPSLAVLGLTQQLSQRTHSSRHPLGEQVLVVGNPTMPTLPTPNQQSAQFLAPLPGSEQEAQAIAHLWNTQAWIGDRATERKIRHLLPQASLVHFATHGLLDYGGNLGDLNVPGAIALAPTPSNAALTDHELSTPHTFEQSPDDGLLTAEELLDFNLKAQLVILSACDTGQGTITGDGVVGLSRALITAGVPQVMVSLWQVPDQPTAELMMAFHTGLKHHLPPAQALRQAMLKVQQTYPSPENWAAFILIGTLR